MNRSLPSERIWRMVLAVALGLAALGPVQAQLFDGGGLFNRKTDPPRAQTEDEIGVPVPVTGRVEALKGHEVTFEIRAESKTPGATVEFLIRAFPSAGKIVSLVSKPNERNKAIVTYWADPSSSATSDAFSFAVRYRGGRYSAEMRYDIDLVDLKTEIQVPLEIDFGEVLIGSEEVREITVRNLGNGSMERQIFLAPPWHLLDPVDGKLNLGPRGGRVLKVAFRPELTGETSYFLSFSRSKSGTTKLIGRGADPFQIETETIELALDERSGERRGEILLHNPGAKAVSVEARASTRLEASLLEGYLLAPGQSTKVPVKLGATDTAPFDGSVEFFLKNGYAKPVRVIAPVVPGRLEVSVPNAISAEILNFGKVEAGRSSERGIVVTNRGGVAVPVEFHLPAPFRLLTKPAPQLAPLSSMNLSIGLFPAASERGLVDVTMNVYGTEQTVPVRLLGNIVAPSGVAAPGAGAASPNLPAKGFRLGGGAATPAADPASIDPVAAGAPVGGGSSGASFAPVADPDRPPAPDVSGDAWSTDLETSDAERARSPLGFLTRPLLARNTDPTLRKPEDLTVLKSRSDSVVLAWTAPRTEDPVAFDVEMRSLFVNDETRTVENLWTPYPQVKVERIDRLVKAELSSLRPASRYELRVVLNTADGRSSPPSEVIVAQTELPMDWTYLYLGFGVLVIIALGLALRKIYLARRAEVYQSQYADI